MTVKFIAVLCFFLLLAVSIVEAEIERCSLNASSLTIGCDGIEETTMASTIPYQPTVPKGGQPDNRAKSWCIRKDPEETGKSFCPNETDHDEFNRICSDLKDGETARLSRDGKVIEAWCCKSNNKNYINCDTDVRICGADNKCQAKWCFAKRSVAGNETTDMVTICPSKEKKEAYDEVCDNPNAGNETWIEDYTYCCKNARCLGYQACETGEGNTSAATCDGSLVHGSNPATTRPASFRCVRRPNETASKCLPNGTPHEERCMELAEGMTLMIGTDHWCCRGVGGKKIACDTSIRICGTNDQCNSTWCYLNKTEADATTTCPGDTLSTTHDVSCNQLKKGEEKLLADNIFCCNQIGNCSGTATNTSGSGDAYDCGRSSTCTFTCSTLFITLLCLLGFNMVVADIPFP